MCSDAYAVVDIGGTKVLLLFLHADGTVLYRVKSSTSAGVDKEELACFINRMIKEAAASQELNIKGVGVCIAGLLDYHNGEIISAPNIELPGRYPLRDLMQKEWEVPVLIENDGNAAVLGEVFFGAARGLSNVIYVTVSTGIGSGFYLNNQLYRGSRGYASEMGHIKGFGFLSCKCGGEGCLEAEASGEAIARKAVAKMEKEWENKAVRTAEVFEKSRKGDPIASEVVEESLEKLGLAFANLVTVLDPQAIVVGGGVSNENYLLDKIKYYIQEISFNPGAEDVLVTRAELDPESGIWGMFYLIKEKILEV